MEPRIYPKNGKFVIQDMENNRKQIGKGYKSPTAAKAALKKLIEDVATKKVVVGDRYKFKETFKNYAQDITDKASDKSVRLTEEGVRAYGSLYRNYIEPYFPDTYEIRDPKGRWISKSCVYLDEINGQALEKFIINIYKAKNSLDRGYWKTAKNIVSHIKTFLRKCDGKGMPINHSVFNWKMADQYHLQPMDDDLYFPKKATPINPQDAIRLVNNLVQNKDKDFYSAYKLIAFSIFIFTGIRFAEAKGIKKDAINLSNHSIFIGGVFNHRENLWKNKTKTQASKRDIEILDEFMAILKWWLVKIKDMRNPYLLPSTRGTGPISEYRFRKLIWQTYEENDLATIEWKTKEYNGKCSRGRSTSFRVIESPFKGCPTKTFRHSLATHLVNAVKSDPALDTNYVRSVLGHGDFNTTQGIYGKHIMRVTEEERAARRAAVSKATKAHRLIQK